jgi:hypothetical protein
LQISSVFKKKIAILDGLMPMPHGTRMSTADCILLD